MPESSILTDFPLSGTPYGRIWTFTNELIKANNLPSIAPEKVVQRKFAWHLGDEDPLRPPYVITSRRAETIDWREGTNERDAIQYAVMVSIALASGLNPSMEWTGLQEEWRKRVRRLFHNKGPRDFPGLTFNGLGNVSFNHSYVESGDHLIEEAKRRQMDAQYWLIRFNVWEPRS